MRAPPAWTLKAPDAQLIDKKGKPFGKHFAGPSWQASDGSSIKLNSGNTYVDHAFVHTGRKMRDLNALIPQGSGWVLSIAYGVHAFDGNVEAGGAIDAADRAMYARKRGTRGDKPSE